MSQFVFLPIMIPFVAFCATLVSIRYRPAVKGITILSAAAYLILGVWLAFILDFENALTLQVGSWPAPFGIRLSIDKLSALLIAVTGIVYFIISLYAEPGVNTESSPVVFPLINILICGISGAFITADLFNLYVWFEVILLASFVLTATGTGKRRLAGSFKYLSLNILSSMLFLLAAGLIYNAAHTLDFNDLGERLILLNQEDPWYISSLCIMLFTGFAIKSGLFPFYFWLPASYHHLSPAVSALFAGMLTKVGLYAIFRVSLSIFPANPYLVDTILILGPLTMLFGVIGAIAQTNVRRILSFHIISQVGYIVVAGVFVSSPDPLLRTTGFAAAIFYMIHHILVKTNLFLVSGLIFAKTGTEDLSLLGGFRKRFPLIAFVFAVPALSLAGIPPSSGFWAKFALIKASLQAEYFFAAIAMVIAGFFTVFSMVKIWNGVFWSATEPPQNPVPSSHSLPIFAAVLLALVSLSIGFFPDILMQEAIKAAAQLKTFSFVRIQP